MPVLGQFFAKRPFQDWINFLNSFDKMHKFGPSLLVSVLSTPNEEDDLTEGSNGLLILFDCVCQKLSFSANIGNIF